MTNPSSEAPKKLPKLRKDITVIFNDYNIEGKPEWLIHDAGRNKFYIIGWPEFEILERWDLGEDQAIVASINKETTLHVDVHDVEKLLYFLSQHYLISQSSKEISKQARDQKLFKTDNPFHWLISYYLFFRIPLLRPNNFLSKTKIIGKILFSRYTAYVMLLLALLAVYQLGEQWDGFTHSFSSIFNWQGLFFYFIAFSIVKLCHELGHAYMCKRYGIPVPTLGVAFLVFWPVLYTDTTLSWSLSSKKRLRISLAGIWVESYITILAALIWCNTHNLTLQAICYVTITVNWIGSLLINVSPFMRFDGYFILSDLLHMPNLQPRAFALARWQIRKWLFGWEDPPPENFKPRMHYFLVIYSIITWLYRLVLYFGIALLVYHFFVKLLGIVLFVIELFYFILSPIISEIKTWITLKDRFSLNNQTKITIVGSIILLFLLMIPFSNTISLPATLRYGHVFLIAPTEGVLGNNIPAVGTHIEANTPIVTIISDDLDESINQVKLEYLKKLTELRRTEIDAKFSHDRFITLSDLKKKEAEYQKLVKARNELTLMVKFNGILIESDSQLKQNTFVVKNQWLADIVNPNKYDIEAYISQIDANRVAVNQTGYFYPTDLSQKRIAVKVISIEIMNASQLNCDFSAELKQNKAEDTVVETPCYNISELGGQIPTYLSEEGKYIPVDSVYRVLLTTPNKVSLSSIERGTVVLDTTVRQSIAFSFFYNLKKAWVEQSSF